MKLSNITSTFTAVALFASTSLFAAAKPKNNYIDVYKDIALAEKQRSGILASITLGQGIFESGWGMAPLATQANNHFGIKCGSTWNGDTFAQRDDDRDNDGNLIESCFRVYQSAEHSFADHTDFLLSGKRYENLFAIEGSNYREWAYGLQRAGYATDSLYAEKLIRIIETYELYKFDGLDAPIPATVKIPSLNDTIIKDIKQSSSLQGEEIFELSSGEVLQEQNVTSIATEEFDAPKAVKLPDNYEPNFRQRLDNLINRFKHNKGSEEKENNLDEILPKTEEEKFQARGINQEQKYVIVRERKIK